MQKLVYMLILLNDTNVIKNRETFNYIHIEIVI